MTAAARDKPSWLTHFERAQAELAAGRSRAALPLLEKATALNPRLVQAWGLLGDILTAAGDFVGARQAYDRRLALMVSDPRVTLAAETLAASRVLLTQRRFIEAVAEFDRLLADDPTDCSALAMKAAALTEIGRYAEAAEITGEIAERFADQPYAWLVHAGGLRALGKTKACMAAYLKSIALEPSCAEAYLSLANLKTYRFTAGQIAAMEALIAGPDLQPEDRAKLGFALGKAQEDAGAYALAFGSYTQANAIERARRAYDPSGTSAYVRTSKALFTADFFAERAGWGDAAPDPIFIVGLPRSGSTLVEQILASHPMIEGTHELPDLTMLAAGLQGYPESLAALTRGACGALGGEFLRRTGAYRNLGRPRFIDKTPKNFLHIGLIKLILPNARIVDVRRHPLACGVSIFRQHFGLGFSCAFDLDHIGRYYADYVDLMAHFDDALPGAIHRVIYESLVQDTEGEVRSLLDYLGLPFDPACLRFFENRRAVDTPSSEQVRQPIFTDALGQWRDFEPWLDPLKAALGPILDAYPATPAG